MFWTNKAFEIVILLLGLGIVRVKHYHVLLLLSGTFPYDDSRLDCIYFFTFLIG